MIPLRDINPTSRFPVVTVALIVTNVLVFFAVGSDLRAVLEYGVLPCDLLGECPRLHPAAEQIIASRSPIRSLFTSMFMHGDILHLGFNMLFLWVFGNNVEDRLTPLGFSAFYLVTGLAGSLAHIAVSPMSEVPMIGASGAISGILGAYIVLWPSATVVSLVPLVPLGFFFFTVRTRAWVILGIWFVTQLFGGLAGLGQAEVGGVAFLAHLGGFVAGLVLAVPVRLGGRRDVTWRDG